MYQDQHFKSRRKELRNNPTSQEEILWNYLRKKNLGFKFQRQYSIGLYIVDFYCAQKRLIIELDGSQHLENKEYDAERTYYLEALGCKVLRFWNSEIDKNLENILDKIRIELNITPSAFGRHPS